MPTLICRSLKHEIYKKALENYLILIKNQCFIGLCANISRVVCDLGYIDKYINFNIFSLHEFTNQKPKNILYYEYWFEITDTQSRINILENCIKLTAPRGATK